MFIKKDTGAKPQRQPPAETASEAVEAAPGSGVPADCAVTYLVEKPGIVKRVSGILLTLEVILLAILAAASLAPQFFGITPYGVLTGSMEPNVPRGSLALVDTKVEPAALEPGDVVAFKSGDKLITHRIVENDAAAQAITTKGDANADMDPGYVAYADVVGQTVCAVPQLGSVLYQIEQNKLTVLLILGGFTLALALVNWAAPSKFTSRTQAKGACA